MIRNEKIVLKSQTYINKFDSNVFVYDVDGVQVVFMDNSSNEYAFCAAIYNNHVDNKGLPHLTEHCIFGGSEKYRIQEPFEYLVQNEKYTYLNAITFRDRTTYLFSTYEQGSFEKIFDVYMDAIFNPLLTESTFKQECFRTEFAQSDEIIKNGIVYNEMLDMYNDSGYVIENDLVAGFSKNYYNYNAHGRPESIEKATNNDVKQYYYDNYTKNNMIFTFYGCNNHEQYLDYIYEISKNKTVECKPLIGYESDLMVDLNLKYVNDTLEILLIYVSRSDIEEQVRALVFKTIFSNENINSWLGGDTQARSIQFSCDNTGECTLLKISIESKDKVENLNKKDISNFILEYLENIDVDFLVENIKERLIALKIKDYGYKTEGIFNLLEITKRKLKHDNFLKFYENDILKGDNVLEIIQNTAYDVRTSFMKISEKNIQKCQNNNNLKHKLKIKQEKFDKVFEKSTKCDIIDMIIIIKFNNLRVNCVKSFNLSGLHDYLSVDNFDINTWFNDKNNMFYLNLSVYYENHQTLFKKVEELLTDNKFCELLNFENDLSIMLNRANDDNSIKINDLIENELELYDVKNKILENDTIQNFELKISKEDNFKNILKESFKETQVNNLKNEKIVWELYWYNNGMFFNINNGEGDLISNNNNQIFRNKVLSLQQLSSSGSNKIVIDDFSSNSIVYKNILMLDIGLESKNNRLDYFYIELILEALVNERLYKIVRLKNGAYEVNYKLFKLDNKVVLYSNIDKYSNRTLEIFKKELNNLNELSLNEIKKYLNKITNNFYRNEQNRNMKIYKDFVNYVTNSDFKKERVTNDGIAEAIKVIQNAKIILEKSYS